MITRFEVSNYGPIKSAAAALTPLHAFIGPNDSGKSSILRALVTAINVPLSRPPNWVLPQNSTFLIGDARSQVSYNRNNGVLTPNPSASIAALQMQKGARLVRFEADSLRAPGTLVTEEQALDFVDNRGRGLPGVYDVLLNRNDESFQTISRELSRLFPTVDRLRLLTVTQQTKTIAIDVKNAETVTALSMSEGMLFFLAYAALQRLLGVSLLAIEEPETGLHPARISEVMKVLRSISESGIQVVIATHSPLVVNELKPTEVSVVTRTVENGSTIRAIAETANFEKRSKVYALGELWVSYANGLDEGPLLEGEQKQ